MEQTIADIRSYSFLQGGGELGALTRKFDWSTTSVGSPDKWPQSLRITIAMILSSKFPMFLWWGPEMIQFYNDAYRPSLGNTGKHPKALGQKGKECWPEIWDIIYPLIYQVRTTGEATWSEDQLVPIYRNGKIEDVYWTFGYSPIRGADDNIEGVLVVCTETTQKVLNAQKLEKSVANLHNMILQAPVAMCILKGPLFLVDIANERMFQLWGKIGINMQGRPLFEGLPEAKGQGFEALLQKVYTTGETFITHEHPVALPREGKIQTVYVNFAYQAYREEDGTISGVMVVANEVTEQVIVRHKIEEEVTQRTKELGQANEALTRINQELARSNKNLQEFAYAASHDLKEPVRKMHYFGEHLKSVLYERLGHEERRLFERMEKATIRMNALIEDLLMYSQVSHHPLTKESVDINKLIGVVLHDLDLVIEQKNAVVQVGELCVVQGHYRQLQQAFQNLIDNSLKYIKEGVQPQIKLSCIVIRGGDTPLLLSEEEQQKNFFEIEVRDNGIGFAHEDAERIFNIFTRLHGNAEYRGTGIGLSIVRKVIENHNGYIWAESEPGKGAQFKVLLPAE